MATSSTTCTHSAGQACPRRCVLAGARSCVRQVARLSRPQAQPSSAGGEAEPPRRRQRPARRVHAQLDKRALTKWELPVPRSFERQVYKVLYPNGFISGKMHPASALEPSLSLSLSLSSSVSVPSRRKKSHLHLYFGDAYVRLNWLRFKTSNTCISIMPLQARGRGAPALSPLRCCELTACTT